MERPGSSDSKEGYAVFLIAGKEYGINVKILASIIDPLRNYSSSDSYNINSESLKFEDQEIPLIDIYKLFKINAPPHSKETRLIIVTTEEQESAAFFVEKVKEFISLDIKNSICLNYSDESGGEYLKWQLLFGHRYIIIPDYNKILTKIKQN